MLTSVSLLTYLNGLYLHELFNGTKKITSKYIKDKYGKNQLVLEATDVSDPKEVEKLQDKIETSLCLTNYKTFKLGSLSLCRSRILIHLCQLNHPQNRRELSELFICNIYQIENQG